MAKNSGATTYGLQKFGRLRTMKTSSLPYFLHSQASAGVVVKFEDGDRYPAEALDLQGENDDGEFEIYVEFRYCLGESRSQARALAAGADARFPGCWWTSVEPREPVAMTYMLRQIVSVFDDKRGYFVYERAKEPVAMNPAEHGRG